MFTRCLLLENLIGKTIKKFDYLIKTFKTTKTTYSRGTIRMTKKNKLFTELIILIIILSVGIAIGFYNEHTEHMNETSFTKIEKSTLNFSIKKEA